MGEQFDVKDYAIICREFSKSSPEVTAYEVKCEITNSILNC